eukprot:759741-Hanusia_phi.AAC.1
MFRGRLFRAVVAGDEEEVKKLIEAGDDVNENGYRGAPLHEASRRGRTEMVQLLCASSADVNARDITQETPLHCAVSCGQLEVNKTVHPLLQPCGKDSPEPWSGGQQPGVCGKHSAAFSYHIAVHPQHTSAMNKFDLLTLTEVSGSAATHRGSDGGRGRSFNPGQGGERVIECILSEDSYRLELAPWRIFTCRG